MAAPRKMLIDATRTAWLRAGIKWDPLERDTLDALQGVDTAVLAQKKLKAIPRKRFLLSLAASLFRMTWVLRPVGDKFEAESKYKVNEKAALEKFLAQNDLPSFDLDLCCFCYDSDGKLNGYVTPVMTEMNGIQKSHAAFVHTGDDVTGAGEAFDEELLINVNVVDPTIQRIFVVVLSANHGFNEVKGGFWSIIRTKDETELMAVTLKTLEKHRLHIMAKITREGEAWSVEEVAQYCPLSTDDKTPLQERVDQALTSTFGPHI